jgi:hypothetical protein
MCPVKRPAASRDLTTEKSLALAQKYLDSSGSKKQEFAEEEVEVNIICIVKHGLVVGFVVEFFTPVFGLMRFGA